MAETIKTILTADGSQFVAVFKQAQDAVQKLRTTVGDQQAAALAMENAHIKALQLEASGQKAAAAALRERLAMQEAASRIQAKTGAGETEALVMAHDRILAEKKLAAARTANSAKALPELVLTPEYLRATEKITAQKKELARAAHAAGRGGMAGSMGFLAFSQAVEDSQYGIRGVLNNIPQMVMGFGGTMGLAGAISLAAVAATALYPLLQKVTGSDITEQLKKGSAAFAASWEEAAKSARALKQELTLTADIATQTELRNQSLRASLTIQNGMIQAMERELTLRQKSRALADELTAARGGLITATGGDPRSATAPARQEEMDRLRKDASTNQKIIQTAIAEASRIDAARQNADAAAQAEISSTDRRLEETRRQLSVNKARLSEADAKKAAGDTSTPLAMEIARLKRAQTVYEDTIAKLAASRAMVASVAAAAASTAQAELNTLNSTIQARNDEVEAIKAQLEQRKKLFAIQDATAAADAWATWQDAVSKSKEEAAAAATKNAEAARAMKEAAEAAAEQENRKFQAKAGIAAELAALQLQLRGRADLAAALTKEVERRRQAADLAAQLGITEQKALAIIRAKEKLTERLEGPKKETHKGILGARFDAISGRLGSRTGFANLRAAELERRASKRGGGTANVQDAQAAKYWERQLDLQQKLVTHLGKLGLA